MAEMAAMYENGKQYSGTFAGIKVSFVLVNFSKNVADKFNKLLVQEAMKNEKLVGRSAVGIARAGSI